ncbi:hypothetical protein HDU93_000203 [Gonapodya sp. JEL0774]|nr:hypothetical protein HDU93_000203 [Gonapodya sp. JEL0774]
MSFPIISGPRSWSPKRHQSAESAHASQSFRRNSHGRNLWIRDKDPQSGQSISSFTRQNRRSGPSLPRYKNNTTFESSLASKWNSKMKKRGSDARKLAGGVTPRDGRSSKKSKPYLPKSNSPQSTLQKTSLSPRSAGSAVMRRVISQRSRLAAKVRVNGKLEHQRSGNATVQRGIEYSNGQIDLPNELFAGGFGGLDGDFIPCWNQTAERAIRRGASPLHSDSQVDRLVKRPEVASVASGATSEVKSTKTPSPSDDIGYRETSLPNSPWFTPPPPSFPLLSLDTFTLHLHRELLILSTFTASTPAEARARSDAVSRLDTVVRRRFKGAARVQVFGSVATGLEVVASDVDTVVMVGGETAVKGELSLSDRGCLTTRKRKRQGSSDSQYDLSEIIDISDSDYESDSTSQATKQLTQGAQSKQLSRISHALRTEQTAHARWERDRLCDNGHKRQKIALKESRQRSGRISGRQLEEDNDAMSGEPVLTAMQTSINLITRARVPVLKYVDAVSGYEVDTTYQRFEGLRTAKWAKKLVESDWRIRPLVVAVKEILRARQLGEVFSGGLGGYALLCMVLGFLRLQHIFYPLNDTELNRPLSTNVPLYPAHPSDDLGLLFTRFLLFFGPTHIARSEGSPTWQFDTAVLCPGRTQEEARVCSKSEMRGVMEGSAGEWRAWKLSIQVNAVLRYDTPFSLTMATQDPFNPANDITRGTTRVNSIRDAFGDAYLTARKRVEWLSGRDMGARKRKQFSGRDSPSLLEDSVEIPLNSTAMRRRRRIQQIYGKAIDRIAPFSMLSQKVDTGQFRTTEVARHKFETLDSQHTEHVTYM